MKQGNAPERTPEELEEQTRLRQEKARADRAVRKACEEAYNAIVDLMGGILTEVREAILDDDVLVEEAVEKVMALLDEFDPPLVLENMQLAHQDSEYYQYHAVNVSLLGAMIGRMMNLAGSDVERLAETGLVMDFGMLRLGGNIADRDALLNAGERVRVRQHMLATRQVLEEAGITDALVLEAVLYHHERYNGKGYLRRLSGEEIPLLARIISVADSFDAALAQGRYKRPKTIFQAMMELELNPDNALDPQIAALTVRTLAETMVGCFVVLSDRSVGKIVQMDPGNYVFPVVVIVGRRTQTGPNLYPVALSRYLPLM